MWHRDKGRLRIESTMTQTMNIVILNPKCKIYRPDINLVSKATDTFVVVVEPKSFFLSGREKIFRQQKYLIFGFIEYDQIDMQPISQLM